MALIGLLVFTGTACATTNTTSEMQGPTSSVIESEVGVTDPTTTLKETSSTSAAELWYDETTIEVALSAGGSAEIRVQIGQIIDVSDPATEINSSCPFEQLPKEMTSYQPIRMTLTSTSSRPSAYPRLVLGLVDSFYNFSQLGSWVNGEVGVVGHPFDCVPKYFEEYEFQTLSVLGIDEQLMSPGTQESIQVLTYAPLSMQILDYSWAILITESDDEATTSARINPTSILPSSRIIELNVLGSNTSIPPQEVVTPAASAVELLCEAIRSLPRDPSSSIVQEVYELADQINLPSLSFSAKATARAYELDPDAEFLPSSYVTASDECSRLGF